MYRLGPIQKKIILTIVGGVTLGMQRNPNQYFKTLKAIKYDWRKINQQSFKASIQGLINKELLQEKRLADGTIKLTLTAEGKIQSQKLSFYGDTIKFKKPKKWNKQWLIVAFDIPEKDRLFRSILRAHLRTLEFKRLQNSVFISPHPFQSSILELASLYRAKSYVRVITVSKIDNEKQLKKHFFKK